MLCGVERDIVAAGVEVTKGQTGQRQEAVRTCGLLDVEFHSSEAIWSRMVSSEEPGVAISANEALSASRARRQPYCRCEDLRKVSYLAARLTTGTKGWR